MAVKGKGRRPTTTSRSTITKNDLKMFGCIAIFLISVLLKYADYDTARQIRMQAAALLHGGTDTQEVMSVLGRAAGDSGILEVFQENELAQAVFSAIGVVDAVTSRETANSAEDTVATTDNIASSAANQAAEAGNKKQPTDATNAYTAPAYAESGYSEDLTDREQTVFPKISDETNYMMSYTHVKPVEATISSDYGARTHPISGKKSFHFGIDLAAPKGTAIGSLADGTVRETGNGSYGNYLIVDHAEGFSTLYAHCDKVLAQKGDKVTAGKEIAKVGATGNATGNHLHLEVWRDGKTLNPLYYAAYP